MLTIALTHFTEEEPEAKGEFTEPFPTVASGRAWDSDATGFGALEEGLISS